MKNIIQRKIGVWFWSFMSGMGLVSSIVYYKVGFKEMAFTQFALSLVTTLVAILYLEGLSGKKTT